MKELEKIADSNGELLEIVDAEARADISEIKSSLSDKANKYWTGLGAVTATGNLTLNYPVTNYSEILICLQYPAGSMVRQSVVVPMNYFIAGNVFPDFVIANTRIYFGYSYTDSTHINITSFEKGSLSTVIFLIFAR